MVLIIDDDLQVLNMISGVLARDGCQTVEATTPAEALGIATQVRINILLVDAVLPEMSGPDLLAELSKLQEFEKAFLMSGLDSLAVRMACGKPGHFLIRRIQMDGVSPGG